MCHFSSTRNIQINMFHFCSILKRMARAFQLPIILHNLLGTERNDQETLKPLDHLSSQVKAGLKLFKTYFENQDATKLSSVVPFVL